VSVGLASDLLDGLRTWWVLVLGAWFGLLSAAVAVVVLRRRKLPAPLIVVIVYRERRYFHNLLANTV
jgi:hypothetical protein